MKTYESYKSAQESLCLNYKVRIDIPDRNSIIGIADIVFTGHQPINGLRHPPVEQTCGWYIWAGEILSSDEDFFKPYHIKHLVEFKPEIIKYLGLPPGYRFLFDRNGYEDIWEDKSLLNI